MNWIDEVQLRLKRKNQVLFAKDSEYLQDLIMLFQSQAHKTMILWALDFAAELIVPLAEKYPNELRPKGALEASKDWASFLKNNRCIFCVFSSLFGGSSCLGIICFGTADTTTCGKLILRYLL